MKTTDSINPDFASAAPAQILSPSALGPWRAAIAPPPSGAAVIVLLGMFDLLQPGNLCLLRQARRRAQQVCVLLQPDPIDSLSPHQRRPQYAAAERAEFLSYFKEVDIVSILLPDRAEATLRSLQPFTWLTGQAPATPEPQAQRVLRLAAAVEELPWIPNAATRDIDAAIRDQRTPVPLPDRWEVSAPQPTPAAACASHRVTVNGCFDLLHIGHTRFLFHARPFGTELLVLVNDDDSIRRYKGPTRPVFPLAFRREALLSLRSVTGVCPFPEDDPLRLLGEIKPAVHVKGGSYEEHRVRAELQQIKSWGGRLEFCPLVEGYSSTEYIQKILGAPAR